MYEIVVRYRRLGRMMTRTTQSATTRLSWSDRSRFIMASRTKCAFARACLDSVLEVGTKLMKACEEDSGIRGLYTAAESPS
jgi:hypothetical protein